MAAVILYGCGGHARSIINVILEKNTREEILLVDEKAKDGEIILGCRTQREYILQGNDNYIIAVGDNGGREKLYQKLLFEQRGHCMTVISGRACVGIDTIIGRGVFIAPAAYIGPQAVIGDNTIINTGSIIEHEVRVGSNTHIAPHVTVCGRTSIGNNVLCGAGSILIDKVHICDNVIIGAGAVVKEDIIESGTYVGVPARKV